MTSTLYDAYGQPVEPPELPRLNIAGIVLVLTMLFVICVVSFEAGHIAGMRHARQLMSVGDITMESPPRVDAEPPPISFGSVSSTSRRQFKWCTATEDRFYNKPLTFLCWHGGKRQYFEKIVMKEQ